MLAFENLYTPLLKPNNISDEDELLALSCSYQFDDLFLNNVITTAIFKLSGKIQRLSKLKCKAQNRANMCTCSFKILLAATPSILGYLLDLRLIITSITNGTSPCQVGKIYDLHL